MAAGREPSLEASIDALEDGDVALDVSAARAALASRDFRVLFLGIFTSGIGTWMQNITLGAYAWELTESPIFVSLTSFAQLGPSLLLSVVGGALADAVDRRRLIIAMQVVQALATFALAAVATQDDPNRVLLLLPVLAIGIGQTLNAPAQSALLPSLVERRHMAGAISLTSAQLNGARVVGPALGGVLYPALGAAGVFALNGLTYVFTVIAALMITPPPFTPASEGPRGVARIRDGIRVARTNATLRRCLITITMFSLFALAFVGQMPTIADENLGVAPKSFTYGVLYATFAVGAMTGALSIGTFLRRHDLRRVVPVGLGGFALMLGTLAALGHPAPSFPVLALLGFAYFASITSLNTLLLEEVDDAYRGRVLSLWQMGFAGTVPLGVMLGGTIAELVSMRLVLAYGAVAALGLSWYWRSAGE